MGGINANFEIPVQYETNTFEHSAQINFKGLRGGHSGGDIHTGANAISLSTSISKTLTQNQPHLPLLRSVVAQSVMHLEKQQL